MEETKETQDILNKENLCLIFAWDPKDSKWTAEKYKEACLNMNRSFYYKSKRRTKRDYRTWLYKKSSK